MSYKKCTCGETDNSVNHRYNGKPCYVKNNMSDLLGIVGARQVSNYIDFRDDLETLINRYSMENGCDTPDFILANYLTACLVAFDNATNSRSDWYAKDKVEL
jgi:hypothetical protein